MREKLRDVAPGFVEGTVSAKDATTSFSSNESRILVAEDDPTDQRVIQLMLQRAGYSVDVVWNGSQAVAASQARRYDLVLMDCLMPEMNGLEAARHIRKLEEHQPAIIAITAYMKTGYREQCLGSGMDDYLSKPYHWQQLLQLVRKHLERSPQLRMRNND